MERVRIAALFADKEQYGGASVTVCGWAKTIRDMKTFGFIELNDGSCFRNLQVVMDANSLSNYKEIAAQNVGAALIVRGTVVLTPEAKQPLEVKATEIEVEGVSSMADAGITFDGEVFSFNKDFFMFFPKNMDEGVLGEINEAMKRVAANPDFQAEMANLKYTAVTPEQADVEAARTYITAKREAAEKIVEQCPSLDELT